MKSYLSGVGYKAMLGLALAGWFSALQGDGWKLVLPAGSAQPAMTGQLADRVTEQLTERESARQIEQPVMLQELALERRLSVDGIQLGDDEATVRSRWGEPTQVETDLCADFAASSEQGYRYLRYENSRMVVLQDGRVVVVDGGSVGLDGEEFKPDHTSQRSLEELAQTPILSYKVDEGANLHYAFDEGKVKLVSLSLSRES